VPFESEPRGGLVAIAVGLLGGSWAAVLGLRLPHAWMGSVAVLGIGALLATSAWRAAVRPSRKAWALLALLAAVVGQGAAPYPAPERSIPSGVARVVGTVESSSGGGAVVTVEGGASLEGAELAPGGRVFVRGLDAPTGERLRVLAELSPRHPFRNPSPHPAWPSQRLAASGRARSAPQTVAPAPWHARAAHAVRGHLRARLGETLSPGAAALGQTLLLGERHAVDRDARDAVRDAGLAHVLAVSGLHVTLLAGGAVGLLSLLLVRVRWLTARFDARRVAKAIGVPLALGYALMIGDAPSAWRAALTASLAWGLAAAGRRADTVSVTAGAALLLAGLRPDDLARPGFALSILATAAIVSERGALDALWRTGVRIATRTMIGTAPVVVWLFGSLPLVGVLSNVVVVPLATAALLPLYALHAALAAIAPPLAAPTAPLVETAARAFLSAAEVFAAVPLGRDLPPPSVPQGLLLTALCVGWLLTERWRPRLLLAAAVALGLAGAELHLRHAEQPRDVVRVTFLDVGQGDSALVDLPDGRLMVIDAGGAIGGGPDPGELAVVPLLRARRRARVDTLVLSHPHPDHYGGMRALLESVEVGEIWDSGQARDEEPEGSIARMLAGSGAPVREPDALCGRAHRFGDATVEVLAPCPAYDPGWGPNENSLVLRLRYGRRTFLFTGDAEAHAEAGLLARALGRVDVLKVAHHGSRTSSADALLAALRPRVAVVSAGPHNRFGHPHPEVWERLRQRSGCALRTDRHGGVIVESDGEGLRVRPTRGACAR